MPAPAQEKPRGTVSESRARPQAAAAGVDRDRPSNHVWPAVPKPAPARTIHFVSLGCPKNRVDTEVMLGVSDRSGYRVVADPAEAEVIVVNTCGFIEAAKQESIDTIIELAEQ